MSINTRDHALLAKDAYVDRPADGKRIRIGEHDYTVISRADTASGYQGTIYRRVGTGEIIVAHRGTEPSVRDIVGADGGMVLAGVNAQAPDAIAFTRHALGIAKREALQSGVEPSVTVTGHSLGGCLAQITAHAFGLRGETFNAYGAAGLLHGVPRGGTQVVNHVSAVDPVSAASRHFGAVRVYATAADIRHLARHGYDNDRGPDLRAPLPAALSRHSFAQHGIGNFTEGGLLDGENRTRHAAHRTMVERYREDVHLRRTLLSVPWQPLRLIAGGEDDRAAAAPRPDDGHWDRRRERAPLPVHPGPPRRDPAPPPWLHGLPAYVPQADATDPSALLDRLLAALDGGDERAFRAATRAAAQSGIGRALRAEAIARADVQEREAALLAPGAPTQAPPVLHRPGPVRT